MELRNISTNEGRVRFELHLDKEEWLGYLKKESTSLQKRKAVPGYRAGKAPLSVAYKTYGDSLIQGGTNAVINDKLTQACEENDWAPVSQPTITVVAADLEQFCALIAFADYPKVEEMEYRGLKVEKPIKTVTEAQVDEMIDKYMRNHLYVHEVPREARMGDIVEVKFRGTHNGEGFEYDHSDKSRWVVGSGQLFTGLDEAIVGHVAGDDLELTLTMPEDFHREAVAGLTLDLKVHLVGVWARDLLECTDEYVKENVKGFDTVAEFREDRRKTAQGLNDSESKRILNQRIDDALAAAVTCPIPEEMIQVSMNRHMMTLQQLASGQGKTIEQVLSEEGKTVADFQALVRPNCERQVKCSVALDYIVRKEGLQVSRETIDNQLRSYATKANISMDEAARRMGGIESIAEKMLNDRAMDVVRENLIITEVEVEEFPKLF